MTTNLVCRFIALAILGLAAATWAAAPSPEVICVWGEDDYLTDIEQLRSIFEEPWDYPPIAPTEPSFLDFARIYWTDFSRVPTQLEAVRDTLAREAGGVKFWPLRLTRDEETGEVSVEHAWQDTELLTLAPGGKVQTTGRYDSVLRSWALLNVFNFVTYDDLLKEGHGYLDPRRLVLHVWVADEADRAAYETALVAAMKQPDLGLAGSTRAGGQMSLLLTEGSTTQLCGRIAFNRLDVVDGTNFFLEWFSETNATYEIAANRDLTTNLWEQLATGYAAASETNVTGYTDFAGATNEVRFYKVAKTGISIAFCDSNTVAGILDIPVQVGMPNAQQAAGIYFSLDGEGTRAIINPEPPFNFEASGTFDTRFVSNGWHAVQAFVEYATGQNQNGGAAGYSSQIVTIQVANPIAFPEMNMTFGTSLAIRASLETEIADWTVTIRSPSNDVLSVISGTTSNGVIDTAWDGKDTNGVQFVGEFVQMNVTTITTLESGEGLNLQGDSMTITNAAGVVIYHEIPIPDFPLGFIVSYQMLFNPESLAGIQFLNMITQVAETVASAEGVYQMIGDGSGASGTTLIDSTAASWSSWTNSLKQGVNACLFYFGHGGKTWIGSDSGNPAQGMSVQQIQTMMKNRYIGTTPSFFTPYRFVFLDGCNSSDGDWCVAFGIERKKTTSQQYRQNGLIPRAFMGWKTTKAYGVGGAWNNEHGNFIIQFYTDWSTQGITLKQAVDNNLPAAFTDPLIWGAEDLTWGP